MSDDPVEELIVALNEMDLNTSSVKDILQYENIIEKICCNNSKRIECNKHFLTTELMDTFCENLASPDDDRVFNTANFIALLGKYESCKVFITNANLIQLLVKNLNHFNINVVIQSARALANILYENSAAQPVVLNAGAMVPIETLIKTSCEPDAVENDMKFKDIIVGLLLNLMVDFEPVKKKILESNIIESLVEIVRVDLEGDIASYTSQNIFIILVMLTDCIPIETLFTEEICNLAVEMFRKSNSNDFCVTGLEFLEDADLPDLVKLRLAKAGLFDLFLDVVENKPKVVSDEEANKYDLTGKVLANILTGDEAMEYIYEKNGDEIMGRLSGWLSSEDREIVHAGVLCIGNMARTDNNSMNVVEKEIHLSLLNILKNASKDIKMQYAVISTIRNLSIPKVNKVQLVKDGLIDILLPFMSSELKTSPIIFKLVGTFRQVIDGQESLAIELGCNQKIIHRLVKWSSTTVHPWVSSECARFLCWLVKISKDKMVILNILQNGGYSQIMKMLGALHGLMQGEAVSALTVTSDMALIELENSRNENEKNGSENEKTDPAINTANKAESKKSNLELLDFESVLVDGDIGEKLKHLIEQHGVKMNEQILEDVFKFLEIIIKFDKVRAHLNERGLKDVFHSTMQSRDDYDKFKDRIEEIEKTL